MRDWKGFICPSQAADRMHVCIRTVIARAHQSLERQDGEEVWFPGVVQLKSRRILIPLEDVERLLPRRRR